MWVIRTCAKRRRGGFNEADNHACIVIREKSTQSDQPEGLASNILYKYCRYELDFHSARGIKLKPFILFVYLRDAEVDALGSVALEINHLLLTTSRLNIKYIPK
ncbi:hypothetical protein BIW11_12998 [Tropilaelaps mercedesae]|uniref:Uncharacterized protein n=1 Tax=Tropilaelaps mercedesae TaxID=418985 RepID=A0A1V9X4W2_9ACAR|nr:hypothetical protein BIW11_12998 [Tropilaelaps mercedesae]